VSYESLYRCDRELCTSETPAEAYASSDGGAYPGLPAGLIEIRQGEYGKKYTYCSWVCADIEVSKYAELELGERKQSSVQAGG
jgi:hypothetical protein